MASIRARAPPKAPSARISGVPFQSWIITVLAQSSSNIGMRLSCRPRSLTENSSLYADSALKKSSCENKGARTGCSLSPERSDVGSPLDELTLINRSNKLRAERAAKTRLASRRAMSSAKASSYCRQSSLGCWATAPLPARIRPCDLILDISYSWRESSTRGAAATRACRQMEMSRPASLLERDSSCREKSLALGTLEDRRELGGANRLPTAIHNASKTRLGAILVILNMQYHSVCES